VLCDGQNLGKRYLGLGGSLRDSLRCQRLGNMGRDDNICDLEIDLE
jgi:hypothetical protein